MPDDLAPEPKSIIPPPLCDLGESGAAICVLASGSGGNCSVLAVRRSGVTRLVLIDLGLSPRRTFAMLECIGFGAHSIDACLLTHLDVDHFHPGWLTRTPRHTALRLHQRHAHALNRASSFTGVTVKAFDGGFDLEPGVRVSPMVMSHDEMGVAAFRIDFDGAIGGGSLGFATDLGHVTADLVEHMRARGGVDVLAIESNYCPKMQIESDRPMFLKQRIMGGSGHLSNQQSVEAIHAIQPKDHVVLLHLSRQCNDPALVASMHQGAEYGVTITSQFAASRWVRVAASGTLLRPGRWSATLESTATLWTGVGAKEGAST